MKIEGKMRTSVMPLAAIPSGWKVKVVSIDGGMEVKEHLVNIGLDVGSEIEVIKRGASGPFLISVKETRVAIGQGMVRRIMVSVEGTEGTENDFK